jgi:hypothetical protein
LAPVPIKLWVWRLVWMTMFLTFGKIADFRTDAAVSYREAHRGSSHRVNGTACGRAWLCPSLQSYGLLLYVMPLSYCVKISPI